MLITNLLFLPLLQINPRVSLEMYVKCVVIMVFLALFAYGTFFYAFGSFWVSSNWYLLPVVLVQWRVDVSRYVDLALDW